VGGVWLDAKIRPDERSTAEKENAEKNREKTASLCLRTSEGKKALAIRE